MLNDDWNRAMISAFLITLGLLGAIIGVAWRLK